VENITNLNESINQYIDVVKMVNNNYRGKVMNLKEYLQSEQELDFETLKRVVHDYRTMIEDAKKDFLAELFLKLKKLNIDCHIDRHIQVPLTDTLLLQIGIEKTMLFITLYKKAWKNIEAQEKDDIFKKIETISINNAKFTKPNWNGYATIDIMDVESKEFLEFHNILNSMLKAVGNIIEKVKDKHAI